MYMLLWHDSFCVGYAKAHSFETVVAKVFRKLIFFTFLQLFVSEALHVKTLNEMLEDNVFIQIQK